MGGFLANEETWFEIERRWKRTNAKHGVTRFKAAYSNRN